MESSSKLSSHKERVIGAYCFHATLGGAEQASYGLRIPSSGYATAIAKSICQSPTAIAQNLAYELLVLFPCGNDTFLLSSSQQTQ
ncbi:hypothetical protein XA68_12411 [Ophiocordyceps unilateralis]|uniref:Uncharacterized protein n=1 Tax=Ophiocordyceps unilateralis TaxID=268505 RepID=A0A2A9PDD5_OPHUN|nr:hypothetical protein XA68_12411 [Ophiocordyceps unilateralis]